MRVRIKDLSRTAKLLSASALVLIVVAVNWIGLCAFQLYRANLDEMKAVLPTWNMGGRNERALIIAPHCDDETLGCAGLIRKLLEEGAQVHVVVTTNGDGYYEVVRRISHAGPDSYIQFGRKRQGESLAAMESLGVPKENVTFLGYPDRGCAAMWLDKWTKDNLFTSRYTKCSYSPYSGTYHSKTSYCGESVLSDFAGIIRAYKPTTIYYPHPSDQHSDHWSVNCFVTQAIYEAGMLGKVRSALYIVHRGDWPIPQGLHPELPLAPPAYLNYGGMHWYKLDIGKDEMASKLRAIRLYHTQTPFLGEFLSSFDRRNELFGEYDPGVVRRVGRFATATDDAAWEKVEPCIEDPVGDSLRVDVGRGGDIRYVKCCYDERNLYARIVLDHPHSTRMYYGVQVFGLPNSSAGRVKVSVSGRGKTKSGLKVFVAGNTIDFQIPLDKLGKWDALMVCADSSLKGRKIDRSPWRLLVRKD